MTIRIGMMEATLQRKYQKITCYKLGIIAEERMGGNKVEKADFDFCCIEQRNEVVSSSESGVENVFKG